MSKLRAHIQSIDDLSVVQYPVKEWPHPDRPEDPVVLAIKAPTLARRNQLSKLFRGSVDPETGEVTTDAIDWDGLAMAVLGEMVFDPEDMDYGPLFPDMPDREILLEKNGRVCWDLMTRCLEVGGFRKADDESELSPEGEIIDAGKES